MRLSVIATAIAASLRVIHGAPAIIWKNGISSSKSPSHESDPIESRSLLSTVGFDNESSSALAAVVFLVARESDGSEGLRKLTSAGKLPGVHMKYNSAYSIHHHVNGVESSRTMAREARRQFGKKVVVVNLDEFNRKLSSIAQNIADSSAKITTKVERKRQMAIAEADILIVNINLIDDASNIDTAIVSAIDSPMIQTVILSSIRSTNEVINARKLVVTQHFSKVNNPRRSATRRLEDQANNQNNQNNNGAADGIYYVNTTPNIFAGILFFFLFVFTSYLGLSCMNMIEGQDVYVKKMPHIGREV